ncbi:hypothetical protein CH298_17850 [Rhodococcoides fascians]|uniref:AAA family ATPase n=1 Tax=Rhodococcoides fascians TaxID=1828 RepID=UPI000B9C2F7D|nr:AAA family ATPase [Rhodococcus fascians]OZE87220.1 hypothetical protein CH303_18205 [Rhodococcus fascians]OZF14095.1 hypothetical protein CH298_17850 [Rhodococcus fascians]OZF17581.1 hypothetical protein CH297_18235 [Rhodococcus fascians]OZF64171.1 hypothetical protein CH308_18125 [Rhodococcus fascians]OZF66735.1 hypothetical protein CH307_18330 [Rhodococcus fascians]
MARQAGDREHVYNLGDEFVARCLKDDGSLYGASELWTVDNIGSVLTIFTGDNVDLSDSNFWKKLDAQFRNYAGKADADAVELAARLMVEVLHLYYAYRYDSSARNTNNRMSWLYDLANYSPHEREMVQKSAFLRYGIGATGQNSQRIYEGLVITLQAIMDFKKSGIKNKTYSGEHCCWKFVDLMQAAADSCFDGRKLYAQSAVAHVLFPEFIEDSSSISAKEKIAKDYRPLLAFEADSNESDALEGGELGLDRSLWLIRQALRRRFPEIDSNVSFYQSPLAEPWGYMGHHDEALTEMLDVLKLKKQLVLYGPPGTSKSHRARELAEALIVSGAIESRSLVEYLSESADSADSQLPSVNHSSNIRKLQLHPGMVYDDFIGGWQLRGDATRFMKGFLPRLCDEIFAENVERGNGKLIPFVLIMDELNRVDLSRLMGEAFNLLDGRGGSVRLTAPVVKEENGKQVEKEIALSLPENLFIIGTMNEIDQSLEILDYAMRRRFLWFECPFDSELLRSMLWNSLEGIDNEMAANLDRPKLRDQFELYIDAALSLNDAIESSPVLGREFMIGHTIFAEVAGFLKLHLNGASNGKTFLYSTSGRPGDVVSQVWRLSLEPLLKAYLAMRPEQMDQTLKQLRAAFFKTGS